MSKTRNWSSAQKIKSYGIVNKIHADEVAVQAEENKISITSIQPRSRKKPFIPKYDVDGVYKVILHGKTQMQIEMLVGTHVTTQFPWKWVKKHKIMEAIEVGGELSEFYSISDQLEEYDDDNVLMGYIVDQLKDVDEFYVCCTIEARDHCKQQSDKFVKNQEKKLLKTIYKKPRPWKSLGSEIEITELIPANTRNLVQVEIKTKFPIVHKPEKLKLKDTNSLSDSYIELKPTVEKFNNIFRRRVDCASQIAPILVHNSAQTHLKYPKNIWTQSITDALGQMEEIGADVDIVKPVPEGKYDDEKSSTDEDEAKQQPIDEVALAPYIAFFKRMRRPSYVNMINSFLSTKYKEMESVIELNAVMDMYCNDYPNLIAENYIDTFDNMTFEEYVCFTDVRAKNKYISSAVFHPMWAGIVAISYSDKSPTVMTKLITHDDPIQRAVYGINPVMIWSHVDNLKPKLFLKSPREVKTLSFCPFNENILVGGLVNGQIIIWDLTNKLEIVEKLEIVSEAKEKHRIAMNAHMGWMKSVQDKAIVNTTALSNLMNSHYGSVTAIKWMSPSFVITPTGKTTTMPTNETSLQFISGSEDGNILVWNLSVENKPYEVKKNTKRIPRIPTEVLDDVSPYRILDSVLQPCYRIILGIEGLPQTFLLQSFGMNLPKLKYAYIPKNSGTGRKYFSCKILPQDESEMNIAVYCGSQHGELRKITWAGQDYNTDEVVNSEYCDIKFSCFIHDGIVSCTERNPLIESITLTVGGKIFAIWSDKLMSRPIIWKKRPYRLTNGAWSNNKPSLFFISNTEGELETWDLLIRSDKPISVQTLSGNALTGVCLHTLPLTKNLIGVSDVNGSFRMFLKPSVFMSENPSYMSRMESMVLRELNVIQSFISWQDNWIKNNPHFLLEIKRKEEAEFAEKEEKKRRQRKEIQRKYDEEVEAKRLEKMRVIGPEERWQKIIQKLIEKTIAVKKRIDRAMLIEQEKPLRELEAQRVEKERRMLEIMKKQKKIFDDTVALLFPEAIKKPPELKKSLISDDKDALKREYLVNFNNIKKVAFKTVKENPYKVMFSWNAILTESKERRAALNPHEHYVKLHRYRILKEGCESVSGFPPQKLQSKEK